MYNYELLMMMGYCAPIIFYYIIFSLITGRAPPSVMLLLRQNSRKIYGGVIASLWSKLQWLNLLSWVKTLE